MKNGHLQNEERPLMENFDWNRIRALGGSQAHGFEELCAQLARAGSPQDARFDRKGSPDAGVECYSRLGDGGEWGWQAKFFDTLGNAQWPQLDGSVKSALDKHPGLIRYYVCVPLDRADARISGQMSALERWEAHVEKWQVWAHERGMDVEFVWWGSSELIERLSKSDHIGRFFFWFGQRGFDQDWFRQRLDEARKAAGPRYTPETHVELPIAQDMVLFGRSVFAIDKVKSLAIGVRRTHDGLMPFQRSFEQSDLHADIDDLSKATSVVLEALSELEPFPAGLLPFPHIAKKADEASVAVTHVMERIRRLRQGQEAQSRENQSSRSHYQDPLRNLLYDLQRLHSSLREVIEACEHADSLTNGQLLLLKGEAGTGKTHLLCDFAKGRIDAQLPTVLLMGQRFLSEDDPWVQLAQQLDLTGASAEEIGGALEAAAQASDCRALVMIDALNEGNGRKIWQAHLSSFLARLEKFSWIGVVLSVRSSYEDVLIPEDVKDRAAIVTHKGFEGHEYDATRNFFAHHGLEFPSTPILQPEFGNPLFLKTLCKGLSGKGETRIPRGFHGITAVFNLHLDSINARLANDLDYNPGDNLVRDALDNISKCLMEVGHRWLPRPIAEKTVNELLPGRGFSHSLYRGLVTEGVLVEDRTWWTDNSLEEVVFVSYDRLADHTIADFLLRINLDAAYPDRAFADRGGLAFIQEENWVVHQGILAALCIQVPEHTGQELVRLAPVALDYPGIGEAFLESIVWRKLDAFSEDTRAVLNELLQGEKIWGDLLDVLLSVSVVPGHPFNADSLDQRLRQDSMPDRDSWWSIYLHRTWDTQGPVDRLVAWASALSSADDVEDSVVDLSATTLAWMFTTPNRFLRDRATKAMVALLTGRIESTVRLVDRFADVDDLYVLERVYAAAYGVAMRSHNATAVGKVALSVYKNVFGAGAPPVHILLRDYARGVVERAIHLGSDVQIDEQLIRPPYNSDWPTIPSEDYIDGLFPNRGEASWDSGNLEWSRNRIQWSVLDDDFFYYVIGRDSPSHWLALRLDEEHWESPEERQQYLLLRLSESEQLAWGAFEATQTSLSRIEIESLRQLRFSDELDDVSETLQATTSQFDDAIEQARMEVGFAFQQMIAEFTDEHRDDWESIQSDANDWQARQGPRFDKRLIQRYILWRVFDLGWTTERFGAFDRFDIGYAGRAAGKPERIGKKYQWIAYHEMLAYLSDHLQYRVGNGVDIEHRYQGPWQESLRDIDPSCTLRLIPGGTSWGPHISSWWGAEQYSAWQEHSSHKHWLANCDDLPNIEHLLEAIDPDDGTHWLNVDGNFVWRQPHPAHEGPYDSDRREVWIGLAAYFVQANEAEPFMSWAKAVDFWGRWMPEPQELSSVHLGEHGWSPAFDYFCSEASEFENWTKPEAPDRIECPATIQCASYRYLAEKGGFDCSIDDSFSLYLPHQEFIEHSRLQWSCNGAVYLDETGALAAFDPNAHGNAPTGLLLRKDLLEKYLLEKGLSLCWVLLGEKQVVGGDASRQFQGRLRMSGAYRYKEDGLTGFQIYSFDIPQSMRR